MSNNYKLDKSNVEDIIGLTSLQEGILFHYLKDSESKVYCIQLALDIIGDINLKYFEQSWDIVINNNEMLRTVFRWEKLKKPIQIILKNSKAQIRYFDFTEFSDSENEIKIKKLKDSDYQEGFDLNNVPFRITLCKTESNKYVLLISNHHIIYDGWSNSIILNEFVDNYCDLAKKNDIKIKNKTSYKNYIKLNNDSATEGRDFWKDHLSGYEINNIFNNNNVKKQEEHYDEIKVIIESEKVKKINEFCKSNKLTIADVLYLAWGILLSKYSDKEDVLFGTTISGRNVQLKDIENTVGLFINTIPLRFKLSHSISIKEIIENSTDIIRERTKYENVSLHDIIESSGYLGKELYESIFVVENYPIDKSYLDNKFFNINSFSIREHTNYKLTVSAFLRDFIEINFNFSEEKVERYIVERVGIHFSKILDFIIESSCQKIRDIQLLSEKEKNELLVNFNNTKQDICLRTVQDLIIEQINKTPKNIAVYENDKLLTYEELGNLSNNLALKLLEYGINEGDIVPVLIDRSINFIVAITAILRLGGVFLPIDKNSPQKRIEYILNDVDSSIILSTKEDWSDLNVKSKAIFIEDNYDQCLINKKYKVNKCSENAYVIYTSGTTGKPKGALLNQKGLINYLTWANNTYLNGEKMDFPLFTSLAFDLTITSVFIPLITGNSIVVYNTEEKEVLLHNVIEDNKVGIIKMTPSHLKLLLEFNSSQVNLKELKLRKIIVGGEQLNYSLAKEIENKFNVEIFNEYGPTEATVGCSVYKLSNKDYKGLAVPIGCPIANTRLYVFDKCLNLVSTGFQGELYISGYGLSEGYLNQVNLTASRFIVNPYNENELLYKTGDLVRWLPSGDLEFLGRLDEQVKIRGYRIELEEIENVILEYKGVKSCAVISKELQDDDKYLIAYIVLEEKQEILEEQLKNYLSGSLTDYMIPSYFIFLDILPLTVNGKLDKQSLPMPEFKADVDYIAPSGNLEVKLVKIWSDILGISEHLISTEVSFFEIGGHSLKATRLVSQIYKEFDVQVLIQDIFKYQTIKSQSQLLRDSSNKNYTSIPKAKKQAYYTTSSSQRRLFLLQEIDKKSIAYNMPVFLPVLEGVKVENIRDAFNILVNRHEALRTHFEIINEVPVQVIEENITIEIDEYKIKSEDLGTLKRILVNPFNLSTTPLFRVYYIDVIESSNFLFVDMHHIISDGKSQEILSQELNSLLNGVELSPIELQYKDFSEWQNSKDQQERIENQESYWFDKLSGELPVLELPTDYSRPNVKNFEGAVKHYVLSEEESQIIKSICKSQDMTLHMTLLSVYSILLSKLSGDEDIIIGIPIASRRHIDLENIVGMFVNTLALRIDVAEDKSLKNFFQNIKETTLSSYDNQEYQFEDLVENLVEDRDTSRNPIFDVIFNLVDSENIPFKEAFDNELNKDQNISKFDLSLTAIDHKQRIELVFEYCTELFKSDTIERFIGYFREIILELPRNIHKPISEINIISEAEKQKILYDFNDTKVDYPKDKSIHELFEEQVKLTPESLALEDENSSYTYKELNEEVNKLANFLIQKGVKKNQLIGLIANRSSEMIIGILGILKSGCAYVPIDHRYPDERIGKIISECRIEVLLTTGKTQFEYPFTGEIFIIDSDEVQNLSSHFKSDKSYSDDLAYVMFTSGSTGDPKGVSIEHKSVVRLVKNANYIPMDYAHKVLMTGALVFDATTFEIWSALLNGGSLFIADDHIILNPDLLKDYINDKNITTLWLTSNLFNQLVDTKESIFDNLMFLLVGGDVLSYKHISVIRKRNKNIVIINGYGPTENTTFSTTFKIEKEYHKNIPIGKPISNSSAYILSKIKLQPIGIIGELHLGGDGLARGYLNDPELTSEKFIINPFQKGELLYKTGDLVRWLPDGNIEFVGRNDHQVKIRGFRIELGEIENCILNFPGIRSCVVITKSDSKGEKYICAYIVLEEENSNIIENLRIHLSDSLPEYMIPMHLLVIDSIPLTINGKLDRKSLPEPGIKAGSDYVAPTTKLERKLVDIWSEVLSIPSKEISVTKSFFELGGHSLKATILASRIHKELKARIDLRDIFQYQTVLRQTKLISSSEKSSFRSIPQANVQLHYQLSSSQRRLYLLQALDNNSIAYNMPTIIPLPKGMSVEIVTEVFSKLIDRHESLRTSFVIEDEIPVQLIKPKVIFVIPEYQIKKEEINELKEKFIRPFDLSKAPLLRAYYLELIDGDNVLFVDMHHIITDGRSQEILSQELNSLLNGLELSPIELQYKDYSEWQNSKEQQERLLTQESYWLGKLSGELPVLELPTDYPRPLMQDFSGSTRRIILKDVEFQIIKTLCEDHNLTLYMALLSVYAIFLSKLSGQEDIIVGTPVASRRHIELERIVGMFVNTLALRMNVSGEKTLGDFLKELKDSTLHSYEHQEYLFEDLVEKLGLERDTSRNPVFDVMFNFLESEDVALSGVYNNDYNQQQNISKFDLSLTAVNLGSELELTFEYSTQLFKSETIERLITYFRQLILSFAENSEQIIGKLNMLPETEKRLLLQDFNDTKIDYPKDKSIHEIFEERALQIPNTVALVFQDIVLTYQELNDRSNYLANQIIKRDINSSLIGLFVERSIDMLISILGILKSGNAFVPISINSPKKRIEYILNDSKVELLITNSKLSSEFDLINNIIEIDKLDFREKDSVVLDKNSACPNAYLLYTSGSTGNPKGVLVGHKSVVNLLYFLNSKYHNSNNEVWLLKTPYVFDVSISELFGWILSGSRLAILPEGAEKVVGDLMEYIGENAISHINFVPSMFTVFSQYLNEISTDIKSIKFILLAGEALLVDHILKFKSNYPDIKLENLYGPTEATVFSSHYSIQEENKTGNIPIGVGISNTQFYVLNKSLQLQGIGIPGELYIAGSGLSMGYLNKVELTTEKFINNPFVEGELIYKTGDLVRWLSDGSVEFLGRTDDQVKIRGFRIELGEIESCILSYPNIISVSVISREDKKGDKYLCAYVVLGDEDSNIEENLKLHLSNLLPDYMIPLHIMVLDFIPVNINGKLDRKSLPIPALKTKQEYIAPANLIENKLVEIWSDILGIPFENISTNISFFDLGGHSLKATILLLRIKKEFKVALNLRDVFHYQTISSQSKLISNSEKIQYYSIPLAPQQSYYELSSSQRRLYLLQSYDLESVAYNMPVLIPLSKEITIEEINRAFQALVDRHESLRTGFITVNDRLVQSIQPKLSLTVQKYRLKNDEEIGKRKDEFIRPFDLNNTPLIRVFYLEIQNGDNVLLVDTHHIICDGKTQEILSQELNDLLTGIELPTIRLQYKDFSEWQNSKEQQDKLLAQESYWLDKLSEELPVLELPTDFTRPLIQDFKGSSKRFKLTKEEFQIVKDICKNQGLTLYMGILGIYTVFLSKLSGQEDIVIGTPVASRQHADLERIVGMFVNTLALRVDIQGNKKLDEFYKDLKINTLTSFENQEYLFEDLVDKLALERDTSRNPLFDVMFNLLESEEIALSNAFAKNYNPLQSISKFDLSLTALNLGAEIELIFEYSTNLFRPETIDLFIGYFKNIIKDFKDINKKIGDVKLIGAELEKDIISSSKGLVYKGEDILIHEQFSKIALSKNNKEAVIYNGKTITYQELEEKSNSLARNLREKGIKPDNVVGIMIDRSIETIIGILGILKSGGACLPINIDFPEERIEFTLNECNVEILLTDNKYKKKVSKFLSKSLIILDLDDSANYRFDSGPIANVNSLNDLFYIIYTSGSTGQPKGVMLEQKNLLNLIENNRNLNIEFEKVLQFNSISFDVSFQEIFSTLLYGGTLYIISEDDKKDINKLFGLIKENSISTVFLPTSYAKFIFNNYEDYNLIPTCIKHIITAGEQLIISERFKKYLKETKTFLHNHYGPSETHVVTTLTIDPKDPLPEIPSIGFPINNTSIYILDSYKNILPLGIKGEIYIEGNSVGRGYFGRYDLTKEKYIKSPFNKNKTLYRTGDFGRRLSDGSIEFLGRTDQQLKIRGYRIETGEIENCLLSHKLINEVAVVDVLDEMQIKYLCAYIVLTSEIEDIEKVLSDFLSEKLPDYMIPSFFVVLDEIPLTLNGKLNKKLLPLPNFEKTELFEKPETRAEKILVSIWSDILSIEEKEISINSNFFECGGHSLKANSLVLKIKKIFGIQLQLKDIFREPVLKKMALLIENNTKLKYLDIDPIEKREYYTLSSAQKRLYLTNLIQGNTTTYNLVFVSELLGDFSIERFNYAIKELVKRHEVLRTAIKLINDVPVQFVYDKMDIDISYKQIEREEIEQQIKEFVKPFALEEAPLFRAGLLEINHNSHILIFDIHHIISDGITSYLLMNDFFKLYEGKNLKNVKLQYKDYSNWQNMLLNSDSLKKQEKFWLNLFKGDIPELKLPVDFSRDVLEERIGEVVDIEIDNDLKTRIDRFILENESTLYQFLFSVYNLLIHKYSGQDDIIVGLPIAGRNHNDLYNIAGFFVNTLALRTKIDSEDSFIRYFKSIKTNTINAFENQDYPFDRLVDKLGIEKGNNRNPLFDVMFVLQNYDQEYESAHFQLKDIQYEHNVSHFDIHLQAFDKNDHIILYFEYSVSLFKKETIKLMSKHFIEIIEQILDNPHLKLKDFNIKEDTEVVKSIFEEEEDFTF